MKKILYCCLLLISIFSLISCKKKTSNKPTPEVTTPEVTTPEVTTPEVTTPEVTTPEVTTPEVTTPEVTTPEVTTDNTVVLDTPNLDLDEESGVIMWDVVSNATFYRYVINDGNVLTTTSNVVSIDDKSTISVQAVSDNGYSNWSKPVTLYRNTSVETIFDDSVYYVYFANSNLSSLKIKSGNKVSRPTTNPTKENYTFDNWYKDPYCEEVFDFSAPITKTTIIYANYIPTPLIDDVYFWIKADSKMNATIESNPTESNWKFIPMHLSSNKTRKEYYATVTVTNASESSPCCFLITDGLDKNAGRTYWKNNGADFSINSPGLYNIYFSLEYEWASGIHVYVEKTNTVNAKNKNGLKDTTLKTPLLYFNEGTGLVTWSHVDGANYYELIVDNGDVIKTTNNYYNLADGSFITIRACNDDGDYSNYSIPKANIKYILINPNVDNTVYAYFVDCEEGSKAYEKGDSINALVATKENYTFMGWYLDPAFKEEAIFPYILNESTVFYPKWDDGIDEVNKDYYYLTDDLNNKIASLKWNTENLDFYEYKTPIIVLSANKTYKITSLDGKTTYETFTVSENNSYTIYFSEDNIWIHNDVKRHVYVASMKVNLYFSDNLNWGSVYAYMWDSNTNVWVNIWPGTLMTYVRTNSHNQKIYMITVDLSKCDHIIFSNGSNSQTVDISLSGVANNTGYYTSSQSNGKYLVDTYTYS